ncbi:hypothetical protein GCM10011378_39850 [Hymenobacter glacieicola]|uniref:Uncharacterized protein n=1 Tax=Hymenobacter glacieicola TaxID=1562124 RepID=A0ABQ1X812_9BACT|nr:hypothetical protein GCM10011378_39850 [Hymenobacter glacieicola]
MPEAVEISSQEYRVIPAPLYYRNLETGRITVVYGGLADYYGFYAWKLSPAGTARTRPSLPTRPIGSSFPSTTI